MANLSKVIPGLEAFLEGDVNIENNVEVPVAEDVLEQAEDTEEAVATAVEGEEIVAEAEETATQAEMIAVQFSELDAMRDHVAKFGVDRTFLSLCNRDGKLADAFGITMPSCESFDAVGSPTSALSIACMEALDVKAMWESVKAFVKKIWEKIKAMFGRFVEWFKQLFAGMQKRIKLAVAARKNVVARDEKDLKDVAIEVVKLPDTQDAKKTSDIVAGAMKTFELNRDSHKSVADIKAEFENLKKSSAANIARVQSIETVAEATKYLNDCEAVFALFATKESVADTVQKKIDEASKKALEELKTAEVAAAKEPDNEALKTAKKEAADKAAMATVAGKMVMTEINGNTKNVSKCVRSYIKTLRTFFKPAAK
jgi:hypothetical protein